MKTTRKTRTKAAPRFGEVAVGLGLVCDKDVARALELQAYRRNNGQEVPLLGLLLQRMGHLSVNETRRVLLECPQRPKPQAPRPPTAKQRSTRRMTRGVGSAQLELGWFKKKGQVNHEALRKKSAGLEARVNSLEHEIQSLRDANTRWKQELDEITEEMIAKEDLIDSLRAKVARLQADGF